MIKRTILFATVALTLLACSSPGDHHEDQIATCPNSVEITFDAIQYWVGEGENRSMLIFQWNDGKCPSALAWGYRWAAEETKRGYDIIKDIARVDKRIFYLTFSSDDQLGNTLSGLGFDVNGNAKISNGSSCKSPVDGAVYTDSYDFDDWKLCAGTNARWSAGWYEAYWSYWVADNIEDKWEYSGLGASSRVLTNNSVDAWYFDLLNDPNNTYRRCMAKPDNCNGRDFFGDIVPVNVPR
jgi:hypothetical protein